MYLSHAGSVRACPVQAVQPCAQWCVSLHWSKPMSRAGAGFSLGSGQLWFWPWLYARFHRRVNLLLFCRWCGLSQAVRAGFGWVLRSHRRRGKSSQSQVAFILLSQSYCSEHLAFQRPSSSFVHQDLFP